MLSALLAGCAAAPVMSPAPPAEPAATVLPKLAQELLDALPHDAAVWERLLADGALYLAETGEVATKAELLESFGPFPPGLSGSIRVENPRVIDAGDTAVLLFDAVEQQKIFDQTIRVLYAGSQTWRREAAGWRLLSAQTVVRAQDPPPVPVAARRLRDYAGVYALGEKWRFEVTVRDGALLGGPPQGTPRPLIAVGDNVFADAGSPLGVLRIFVRGKDGKVEKMILRRKFADTTWARQQ